MEFPKLYYGEEQPKPTAQNIPEKKHHDLFEEKKFQLDDNRNWRRIPFSTAKQLTGIGIYSMRVGNQAVYKLGKTAPSIFYEKRLSPPSDSYFEMWRDGNRIAIRMIRLDEVQDVYETELNLNR